MDCGINTGEVKTVTPPAVLTTVVLFGSLLSILSGLIGKVKTSIVLSLESANSKEHIYTSKSFGNCVAIMERPKFLSVDFAVFTTESKTATTVDI